MIHATQATSLSAFYNMIYDS